jgi:predicted transcriptional regulator
MNQKTSLPSRSVISVHTKPETTKRLDKLAAMTRRSKSFLANEAIERYLAEEEDFIASIKRGLADVKAGRVYTSEEVRNYLTDRIKSKSV